MTRRSKQDNREDQNHHQKTQFMDESIDESTDESTDESINTSLKRKMTKIHETKIHETNDDMNDDMNDNTHDAMRLKTLSNLQILNEVVRRSVDLNIDDKKQKTLISYLTDVFSLSVSDQALLDQQLSQLSQSALKASLSQAHITQSKDGISDEVMRLKLDAQTADERDDIELALSLYQQYLLTQQGDTEVRLRLARLLIGRGNLERATQIHIESPDYTLTQTRGAQLSAGHVLTLILEAELFLAKNEYRRAYQLASRAYLLNSDHIEVALMYAQCCGWIGEDRLEAEELKRVVLLAPENVQAQARFWSCDYFQNSPIDALESLRDLFEISQDRLVQHAFISGLLRAHHFMEANEVSKNLVQRDPQSQSARLLVASTFFHQAQAPKALAICETLMNEGMSSPSLSSLYLASMISLHGQGDQEHLDLLREWGERSPRVAGWYSHFLEMFGHEEEAHWLRERLIDHYPEARSAYLDYLQSLLRNGGVEQCLKLTRSLLDEDPKHLEAWSLLAQAFIEFGDLDAAESANLQCFDLPSSSETTLRILMARGLYDDAVDLAFELCQQNPSQSAPIEYLINALWHNSEDEEKLSKDLLKIYQDLPDATRPPTLLILFGYLFFHLGHHDLATKIVDEVQAIGELIGFRSQRFRFACELARFFHRDEALHTWSQSALTLYPNDYALNALYTVSLWRQGEYDQAFELRRQLIQEAQDDVEPEGLVELTIWACELKHYEIGAELLEKLRIHPQVSSLTQEIEMLSLRVGLNLQDHNILKNTVELAHQWLADEVESERYELLLDWCLESMGKHPSKLSASETIQEETEWFDELFDEDSMIDFDLYDYDTVLSYQACQWAFEGLNLFPNSIGLRRRQSFILNLCGQIEVAIYAQEQVINSPEATSEDFLSLAHLYESANSINQAKLMFSEAVSKSDELSLLEQSQYMLERACFFLRHHEEEATQDAFEELIHRAELLISLEELSGEYSEVSGEYSEVSGEYSEVSGEYSEVSEECLEEEKPSSEEVAISDVGYLRDVLFIWLSQSFEHLSYSRFFDLAEHLHSRFPGALTSGFLGIAHLYLDQPETGLPLLSQARHYDDYFGLEYAHCLWSLDERGEAISLLSELITRRPNNIDCRHLLLQMLIEEEDGIAAYQQLLKLAEQAPNLEELTELQIQVDQLILIH